MDSLMVSPFICLSSFHSHTRVDIFHMWCLASLCCHLCHTSNNSSVCAYMLIALLINMSHGSMIDDVCTTRLMFSPSLRDMPTMTCPRCVNCLANCSPIPRLCPEMAIFI